MPSEPALDRKALLAWTAIRDNILLAQSFTAGMTVEAFTANPMAFYAATRCLEIISEAARRLRGDQQDRYPELEWRQIEDSGNVFRHQYQDGAEGRVLLTIRDRLPELLAIAERALGNPPAQ